MLFNPPVLIACDHGGFHLKNHLIKKFPEVQWLDLGTYSEERVDYPDYATALCQKLKSKPGSCGVLVCRSGQGMAMRANKYSYIRAALVWSEESARLAREHNDANVLCLGTWEFKLAEKLLSLFLKTAFGGDRHADRVKKISAAAD